MQNKNDKKTVTLVSWLAREYPHHEKSKLWFIVAAVILMALVIYGIFTDGWTFSMALIVAAGAYYVSHRSPPEIVTIAVTNKGIKVGRHMIEYPVIKNFWIAYEPPHVRKIYLHLKQKIATNITIDLETADVNEVKKALKKYITEHESNEEPFTDTLIRIFRL